MPDSEPLRACIPMLVDLRDGRIGIDAFGGWSVPPVPDHAHDRPSAWPVYHPPMEALWQAFEVAGFAERPRDYQPWLRLQADPFDPAFVATLDADALSLCLVAMRRGERFCNGFWFGLLERGSLLAAARRALELADG